MSGSFLFPKTFVLCIMFVIGEAMIEDDVAREHFACDLAQCKGACCTLPGARGAPLDDDEIPLIEAVFPAVRKYLTPDRIAEISRAGLVEGGPGTYATSCLDERDCVFVFYEEGIARCSI